MSMKVLAWLWQQNPPRHDFNADKVNAWFYRAREAITLPGITFAVVTDRPEGLDPQLEVIELPSQFRDVRIDTWKESIGAPQCYVRLNIWHPRAAEIFGAEWLISMDVDATFHGRRGCCNHLFVPNQDVRIMQGTHAKRPYNGGLVMLRAGSRPKVYEHFAMDPQRVAREARARFVGSDQAVISHILGPGEKTWGPQDGVYYFSPRFVREHGGERRCKPPSNLAVLFYPGSVKPWNGAGQQLPWVRAAWEGLPPPPVEVDPVRLLAYRDPKGWGAAFAAAARKRGHVVSLFTRSRMVVSGACFVRLDQQGVQREVSKKIVADLHARGIKTLPTAAEGRLYDDKAAQIKPLGPWLPPTVYFRERTKAAAWLDTEAEFPLVSKSIDGAGSKGVRVLKDRAAAHAELRAAFMAPGIPSVYDRRQFGYVYWQRLVPNNPCDYRVCVVGPYLYGLIRENRPGTIFASGSGRASPLTLATERERRAAELGVEIADALGTQWMAFDIVFDEDERPVVLELSSAWTMQAYAEAPMFSRETLEPVKRTGAASFDVAVEIMEGVW